MTTQRVLKPSCLYIPQPDLFVTSSRTQLIPTRRKGDPNDGPCMTTQRLETRACLHIPEPYHAIRTAGSNRRALERTFDILHLLAVTTGDMTRCTHGCFPKAHRHVLTRGSDDLPIGRARHAKNSVLIGRHGIATVPGLDIPDT
jgi:hypothetical protein